MFSLLSFLFLKLLYFLFYFCVRAGSFYKPTNNLVDANGRVKNIPQNIFRPHLLISAGDQISEFLCYHAMNVMNPNEALCSAVAALLL